MHACVRVRSTHTSSPAGAAAPPAAAAAGAASPPPPPPLVGKLQISLFMSSPFMAPTNSLGQKEATSTPEACAQSHTAQTHLRTTLIQRSPLGAFAYVLHSPPAPAPSASSLAHLTVPTLVPRRSRALPGNRGHPGNPPCHAPPDTCPLPERQRSYSIRTVVAPARDPRWASWLRGSCGSAVALCMLPAGKW